MSDEMEAEMGQWLINIMIIFFLKYLFFCNPHIIFVYQSNYGLKRFSFLKWLRFNSFSQEIYWNGTEPWTLECDSFFSAQNINQN